MDTESFSTTKLTKDRLDLWIKIGYNVMLVGEKGTGKSTQVIDAFNRNNLKWIYFSGATLDPWTDVIGIPKPKTLDSGETVLEYIRPQNMNEDVEAIFVDEYNRCHKKVKNALMELIQFKSINGKKFNNLRLVWAAINPDDEENNYDVEPVDPAQLDRFHIIVNVPYKPDKDYFNKKYPKPMGNQAIKWWELQPDNVKKLVSPRRLDYAIDAYLAGVDIGDILPRISNIKKFKEMLTMNENEVLFETAYTEGNIPLLKHMLTDDNIFEEIKNHVLSNDKYFINISNICHSEKLSALYENNFIFRDWVDKNIETGQNRKILEEKGIIAKKNQPDVSFNNLLNSFNNIIKEDRHEIKQVVKYCKEFTEFANTHTIPNADKRNSFVLKFKPKWKEFLRVSQKDKKIEILPDEFSAIIAYMNKLTMNSSDYKTTLKQLIAIACHEYQILDVKTIVGFIHLISKNDTFSRLRQYYPDLATPVSILTPGIYNETLINNVICLL